mgnify:CR=1 FL=1
MVKTITKIGNSAGLILDQAILELVHLKAGDEVDVTVDNASGTLRIASLRPVVQPEAARALAREFIQNNDELFRHLA